MAAAVLASLTACGQGTENVNDQSQDIGGNTLRGGWSRYGDGLNGATIVDVQFDPRAPGVVYATSANTVYKSTDSGGTWRLQGRCDLGSIRYLAFVGSDPNDLAATSSAGVIASSDGGTTWTLLALDGLPVSSLTVHPAQSLRAYLGVRGVGVMRSDDGGKTWAGANDGYPYVDTLAIDVDPRDPDVVVAGAIVLNEKNGYSPNGVVMRTADGGQSWQTVVQGDGNVWNVTRCASDPNVLYAASTAGIVRSGDGGQTWALSPVDGTVEDVAITPSACDDIYAMVYGEGPRHSTDGGRTLGPALTTGLDVNPMGTWPGRMAVDPAHAGAVVLGSHAGLWTTTNAGAQWTAVSSVLDMVVSSLSASPADPGQLWLTSWGSGVWMRPSSSQSWTHVTAVPADYAFAVDADPYRANRILVSNTASLYQSNDGVAFHADTLSKNTFAFAFHPTDAKVLYAATQLNGVYKSADGGVTWTAMNNGLTPWDPEIGIPVIDVLSIAVDPSAPDTLYIGTNGRGVYKSTDGAQSWTSVLAPTKAIGCLAVAPGARTTVYACVAGAGIQSSTDSGATWTDVSQGLPTQDVNGVVVDASSGDVYATMADGVFVRHGGRSFAGVGLGTLPGKAASLPAIVTDGGHRSLVVAAAGAVYAHAL
jgi:hypothetical protein